MTTFKNKDNYLTIGDVIYGLKLNIQMIQVIISEIEELPLGAALKASPVGIATLGKVIEELTACHALLQDQNLSLAQKEEIMERIKAARETLN